MNKLFVSPILVLSALLSGCAGMNLSGGAIGKSGGAFISADGRGMQGYRGQPVMMQGQQVAYGQPMYGQQGYSQYGQPTMVYQGQMQYQGYPAQMYQSGYGGHGSGVYTAPCQPFNADGLMAWAQGAGGQSMHARSANVSVSGSSVHCTANESASSSGVGRPAVQQMPTAMPAVQMVR